MKHPSLQGTALTTGPGTMGARVAIISPTDPLSVSSGGIDTYVRGLMRDLPDDMQMTLFGCTADARRELGKPSSLDGLKPNCTFVPVAVNDGKKNPFPLVLRYTLGLRKAVRAGAVVNYDVLDFHRMEAGTVFRSDRRPKRLTMHQDYSAVIDRQSEVVWRHVPWLYRATERLVLPIFDEMNFVRHSSMDGYRKAFPALASRFNFLPTFFDDSTFQAPKDAGTRGHLREITRRELGIPPDATLLVFVGRLDPAKDPLILPATMRDLCSSHPSAHLAIIGDGSLRESLESSLRSEGVEARVSLLGSRSRDFIRQALLASDLFVLPSIYEGMPIAVLEALACGLPVVAFPVGELPRMVHTGVNGGICEHRSAVALADSIRSALQALPEMRGRPCIDSASIFAARTVLPQIHARLRDLTHSPRGA